VQSDSLIFRSLLDAVLHLARFSFLVGLSRPFAHPLAPATLRQHPRETRDALRFPRLKSGTWSSGRQDRRYLCPPVDIPEVRKSSDAKAFTFPRLFDAFSQRGLSEIVAVPSTVDSSEDGTRSIPGCRRAQPPLSFPPANTFPSRAPQAARKFLSVPGSGGLRSFGNRGNGRVSRISYGRWTMETCSH